MRDTIPRVNRTIAVFVFLIVFVTLVALALFFRKGVIEGTATTRPTTQRAIALRKPATRVVAARKVEMGWIQSPQVLEKSSDGALNRLIERHNALEDQLSHVTLRGKCLWEIDGPPGTPRDMVIQFDRATGTADVTCGPNHGSVAGNVVTFDANSAVNIDCLYLIGLRKFDASRFKVAPDTAAQEGALVAVSDTEKLVFDIDSGRLTSCQIQTPSGAVVAKLSDPLPLGKEGTVTAPTVIELTIPKAVYSFRVQDDFGKATLTLDPQSCQVGK